MELLRENVSVWVGEKKRTAGKSRFQKKKRKEKKETSQIRPSMDSIIRTLVQSINYTLKIFSSTFFFFSFRHTLYDRLCNTVTRNTTKVTS